MSGTVNFKFKSYSVYVTTVKIDKVLCVSFGLYPSYATGILNFVKEIHFYVLCSEKLNYAD